mgnify:CR=1 FL=1
MSSFEIFQHFNRFKAEHSQLKSAQSYQMFMRNDPLFANYEVVVINAWNFETNGSLEVKLRIAPPPEETADSPSIARDIVLGSRNLNQLLDTDRDELYQSLAAGNSKKSEQGQEVVFMLENLISNADLITSRTMMGVKKGRLYNLIKKGYLNNYLWVDNKGRKYLEMHPVGRKSLKEFLPAIIKWRSDCVHLKS